MAIYAWSDLHTDYDRNLIFIQALPGINYANDTIVIAGDVSDKLSLLEQTLMLFREKFDRVFFIPGNHDLWVNQSDHKHSLEKLAAVEALCQRLSISMVPELVDDPDAGPTWVVPLHSWYSKPEHGQDSLYIRKAGEDPSLRMWMDEYNVRWPTPVSTEHDSPSRHLLQRNNLDGFDALGHPVITASHFLPRVELMVPDEVPDFIRPNENDPAPSFNFSRVAGSTLIEDTLRRLDSQLHIYGHQHYNRWRQVDDTWYVSHCMGYPREKRHTLTGDRLKPLQVWPLPEALNPTEAPV